MSAKQDRQGVRTAADVVARYNFGESFAEVMGIATDARKAADKAQAAAENAQNSADNPYANLTPDEIFNLLTEDGTQKGIYKDPNTGDIYINANYLKTGKVVSADGFSYFDLDSGTIRSRKNDDFPYVEIKDGDVYFYNHEDKVVAQMFNPLFGLQVHFISPTTGSLVGMIMGDTTGLRIGCWDQDTGAFGTHYIQWKTVNGVKTLVAF
jgi:hypothetical protein